MALPLVQRNADRTILKEAREVMAFVPNCTWDIFISFPMEEEEWAKQFEQALKKKIDVKVKFYFANRNWEWGQVSEEMLKAAEESALFVAVLTQRALEDPERFLRQELNAFRKSGPLEGRFCPIPLTPIEGKLLSQLMPPQQAASFWKTILFYYEDDGIPIPLTPLTEEHTGDYEKAVAKAAWRLMGRLEQMKRKRDRSADTEGYLGAGKRVLLAEEEKNISSEWTKVRNLLRNDGATILPNGKYPEDDTEYDKAFKTDLEQADLFVQLLSPLDEVKHLLESADKPSRAQRAADLAHGAGATRNIPILQWRPYSSGQVKPWNDKLLDGCYVWEGKLTEFMDEIRAKLGTKAPKIKDEMTDKPYLYITVDNPDLHLAREMQKAARKSVDAVIMTETNEERKEQFDEAINIAAAVIFLHGNTARTFVDCWLSRYIGRIHLQKHRPRLRVLYQAPPKKKNDEEPYNQFDGLRILGSQEDFTLEGIKQICAELRDDSVR